MFKLPEEIIKDIPNYAENLNAFLRQETSELRFKSLRVAWGIYAQRKENRYMIRVRIPAGQVDSAQLKVLSKIARQYGTGILHFTTRQDIQIHSIQLENTAEIIKALQEFQLSSRGSGGNTIRNIIVSSLSGAEQDEIFDPTGWAIALSEYLLRDPVSFNLPRKLKIAFSNSNQDTAGATISDLGFIAKKKEVNGQSVYGFAVYVGGGMGAYSRKAELLEEFIPANEVGYVAEAVKRVFNQYGNRKNKHQARLRFLLDQLGLAEFKRLYKQELTQLKQTEYTNLRIEGDVINLPEINKSIPDGDKEFEEFKKYNIKSQKQLGYYIVEINLKLGDLSSLQVEQITSWAEKIPTLKFRISRNQNLLIINIPATKILSVYEELKKIELAEPGADSILKIVTCAGATTCNLGLCNSRGLTQVLEQNLREADLDLEVFKQIKIRISGCPNACGHHPFSPIGLHGLSRKVNLRSVPFYKILIGGQIEEGKTNKAKEIGIVPAKNVPKILVEFLKEAQKELKNYADFYQYLAEKGEVLFKKLVEKYAYVPSYEEDASFYKDWGKEEDFSLAGLGPGECGAGVLELIEADLAEANKLLTQKDNLSEEILTEIISLCARALLVVRGLEPKTQEESVKFFYEEFVKTGVASDKFENILDKFKAFDESLSIDRKREIYTYAQELYQEVRHLYEIMDNNFNFPKESKGTEENSQIKTNILNLKGIPCPINYVKIKLALENLEKGEILEVYLDEGEPINNVPASLKNDGEKILEIKKEGDFYKVIVQKG